MSEHELDARNLFCPLPVIRTQDAVAEMQPGDILSVTCTDHGALNDIPTWCRINGHAVLEVQDNDAEVVVRLRVGGENA